jgi:hypothetical protein
VENKKEPNQKQPGEKEPGTFHYNPGNMSGKSIGAEENKPKPSEADETIAITTIKQTIQTRSVITDSRFIVSGRALVPYGGPLLIAPADGGSRRKTGPPLVDQNCVPSGGFTVSKTGHSGSLNSMIRLPVNLRHVRQPGLRVPRLHVQGLWHGVSGLMLIPLVESTSAPVLHDVSHVFAERAMRGTSAVGDRVAATAAGAIAEAAPADRTPRKRRAGTVGIRRRSGGSWRDCRRDLRYAVGLS